MPPDATYHLLEDLRTDYEYSFWVRAATVIGKGDKSRTVTETPSSRGMQKHEKKSS